MLPKPGKDRVSHSQLQLPCQYSHIPVMSWPNMDNQQSNSSPHCRHGDLSQSLPTILCICQYFPVRQLIAVLNPADVCELWSKYLRSTKCCGVDNVRVFCKHEVLLQDAIRRLSSPMDDKILGLLGFDTTMDTSNFGMQDSNSILLIATDRRSTVPNSLFLSCPSIEPFFAFRLTGFQLQDQPWLQGTTSAVYIWQREEQHIHPGQKVGSD